mmetsp:Transcript_67273/g.190355  ORF Transcript_67273/g.190355 Transcript_67273/m.190355 type:complete len:172 (-) Transcript_67273:247-762(-)
MLGEIAIRMPSANSCQNRCKAVTGCKFFSFTLGDLCHLSPGSASRMPALPGDLSGPVACEEGLVAGENATSRLYDAVSGGVISSIITRRSTIVLLVAAACAVLGARAVVGLFMHQEGEGDEQRDYVQQAVSRSAGWLSRAVTGARPGSDADSMRDSRYLALDPRACSDEEA